MSFPSLFDESNNRTADDFDAPELPAADAPEAKAAPEADEEEADFTVSFDVDETIPDVSVPPVAHMRGQEQSEKSPPPPQRPITQSPNHPFYAGVKDTQSPAPAVRLMHFADVHLGIETHGRANPETGLNTRVEDFTKALHDAIDIALAEGVDIAVFAGDAYKVRDPNQTHQRAFAGGLRRLTEAGVPVVMLVGNHDLPNSRGRAHALEIYGLLGGAGVYIMQDPAVIIVPTRRGDVLVAGMPYLTRSRVAAYEDTRGKTVEEVAHLTRDRYAADVAELAAQIREYPEHIAVLTGHFTVADVRVGTQGALIAPAEPQVPAAALALPEFSYVAMGHIHKYQDMNRGAQPPVVYSGSIDRVDFGEKDETKGFVLVEIEKGKPTIYRPVALETRSFVDIKVDTGDADDPTDVILKAIQKRKVADAIVRLTYRVPPERFALLRTDEIKKALGASHSSRVLREIPPAEASQISQAFAQVLTPEKALELYLENDSRLAPRKTELMEAASPLFEILAHEEAALA